MELDRIVGKCMEMCPEAEIKLREKEGLLHILEILPGSENTKKPKADKKRMIKSFARSAAGNKMLNINTLRPPNVLLKTLHHLFTETILNDIIPWHATYDFIMDRLRSIRQDMVIQCVSIAESICILQPIVRFYMYASYTLCDKPLQQFDPHINKTHLQECLKRLLSLYDECDNLFYEQRTSSYAMGKLYELRPQFEAAYLILNLGSTDALTRALSMKRHWRTEIVKLSLVLSLNYRQNNYVKTCRLVKRLPVLLQGLAVSLHLPEIRKRALNTMSVAYSSKNLTFPVECLQELLIYESGARVKSDCTYYGLECTESGVKFSKGDFNDSKTVVKPERLQCVDKLLEECDSSDVILYG